LFAAATRLSLQEKFAAADTNKNDRLEPEEFVASVQAQVNRLLARLRAAGLVRAEESQNPIAFVPTQEADLSLATKVK
jgi:uncharacterized surface protein with fasciclin (FAS1) repeats